MAGMLTFSSLFAILTILSLPQQCSCFVDGFWTHLSTKTKYKWRQPVTVDSVQADQWLSYADDAGHSCRAVHTSIVARHGTRNAGLDHIDSIRNLRDRLNVSMAVPRDLIHWHSRFPNNDNKDLTPVGVKELRDYGERTAKRLQSLFNDTDEAGAIRLTTSAKQRAKDSATAFFEGFRKLGQVPRQLSPNVEELLMHSHKHCTKWLNQDAVMMKERDAFAAGAEMNSVRERLSGQLGSVPVTSDDAAEIYQMCGHETAVFSDSPWCQLLEGDNLTSLEILEYHSDLKYYYEYGPAYNITMQQSGLLFSDIFRTMDQVASSSPTLAVPRGQFGFGHDETLSPLFSAMGLFDGGPVPRADNYAQAADRKFRSSRYLPFASNVQFVLYDCSSSGLQLRLFIDEDEAKFPFVECASQKLCSYSLVREKYKQYLDKTEDDYNRVCENSGGSLVG